MADELWDTMLRFHHEVTLPALRAALLEERRDNQASHAETRRQVEILRAETQRQFDASHADTQRQFSEIREEFAATRGEFAEIRGDFVDIRGDFAGIRGDFVETRTQFETSHADLRRHFDISTESLRHDIGLVAEKVIRVEEKLGQEAAAIRTEMNERFAETHALIRFSHTELDRRIHSLEDSRR